MNKYLCGVITVIFFSCLALTPMLAQAADKPQKSPSEIPLQIQKEMNAQEVSRDLKATYATLIYLLNKDELLDKLKTQKPKEYAQFKSAQDQADELYADSAASRNAYAKVFNQLTLFLKPFIAPKKGEGFQKYFPHFQEFVSVTIGFISRNHDKAELATLVLMARSLYDLFDGDFCMADLGWLQPVMIEDDYKTGEVAKRCRKITGRWIDNSRDPNNGKYGKGLKLLVDGKIVDAYMDIYSFYVDPKHAWPETGQEVELWVNKENPDSAAAVKIIGPHPNNQKEEKTK